MASATSFEHFARAVDLRDALELFASRATSELGRRLARSLRPLARVDEIRARLEEISEAARLESLGGRLPLAGIADAYGLAEEACARGRPLEAEQLTAIADACQAGIQLRRTVAALPPGEFPRLHALSGTIPGLAELELALRTAIDGERVRDAASERLAEIRAGIETLRARLDQRIDALVDSQAIRPYLQSPKPTLRGGRYVLAVKAGQRHMIRGILHGHSQTGETVFIEPDPIVPLGNELSDLSFRERDEVTRILWELTRRVFDARPQLAALSRALGRVDLICAAVRLAKEYGLCAPEVVEEGPLVLFDARHPLLLRQERERKLPYGKVVPLTLRLGEAFDVLVITGPNTGGKTVALKTTGLLAALALSGLPIPAGPGSRLPLYRSFFADIGDEQAIESSLSTFSGHVAEIVRILKEADRRSLVLIDELGAGTDPEEGSALGAAVLEALLARGASVVVTTHLGALKAFAYSRPRAENASVEFDPQTLRPTFRLTLGAPGASHALTIARKLGMAEEVVRRADEIREKRGVGETELLDTIQRLRMEAERDRERARGLLEEAAKTRAEAERERRLGEAARRALAAESDHVMYELHERLRTSLAGARKRAAGLSQAAQLTLRALEEELLGALEHTPFAERRREFARGLVKGARAYVVSFGREGIVTRINKARERVTIKLGDAQVETAFDDISWVKAPGEDSLKEAPSGRLPEGATIHPDGRKRWT